MKAAEATNTKTIVPVFGGDDPDVFIRICSSESQAKRRAARIQSDAKRAARKATMERKQKIGFVVSAVLFAVISVVTAIILSV